MADRESLKEIFLQVSEDGTVTEPQEEGPSYEPIDDETAEQEGEVADSYADGLNDAIDGGISPAKGESA
jgi:hypothetical protein